MFNMPIAYTISAVKASQGEKSDNKMAFMEEGI
ncbi:MAG: hypothetical protein ETSY2_31945 [Candidatus Entotheonella gemina]|uniref:Uncharacterized protein n=1 Tax=Candidatus Entotheonella gemina TaxID=1429439 RepID=W4M193_9BACT|nr:MAG: hypothetical protein ETSY2_31945 [Candidatus Entotheonella gemina]